MKKDQVIYDEMRSLSPYYLALSGIYHAIAAVLCFALGGDFSLPIGAVYGIVLSALNFLVLGKSAQAALTKQTRIIWSRCRGGTTVRPFPRSLSAT